MSEQIKDIISADFIKAITERKDAIIEELQTMQACIKRLRELGVKVNATCDL